jgi:hypothetical protein
MTFAEYLLAARSSEKFWCRGQCVSLARHNLVVDLCEQLDFEPQDHAALASWFRDHCRPVHRDLELRHLRSLWDSYETLRSAA